jgi:hypothetical protein
MDGTFSSIWFYVGCAFLWVVWGLVCYGWGFSRGRRRGGWGG